MPRRATDHAVSVARKALAANRSAQALIASAIAAPPASVARVVADLAVLKGVPFDYLIPNAAMLPTESIRFFYLDPNWLDALIDGAASIGGSDSLQSALQAMVLATLQEAARKTAKMTAGTVSGFLLRSALVTDYPRMVFTAYANNTDKQPLAALRLEALSGDVMIGLFNGALARLDIQQPAQGLQFGFEDNGSGTLLINLRGLGGGTFDPGAEIGQTVTMTPDVWARDADSRVVDVLKLKAALQAPLEQAGAFAPGAGFGPASFAVQLVKAAETQRFAGGAAPQGEARRARFVSVPAADIDRDLFAGER